MNEKRYTSFKEIDQDLKILKLKRDIEVENLKLNFETAKKSFYPTNLLGGVSGIIQKLLISMVAKKILNKLNG